MPSRNRHEVPKMLPLREYFAIRQARRPWITPARRRLRDHAVNTSRETIIIAPRPIIKRQHEKRQVHAIHPQSAVSGAGYCADRKDASAKKTVKSAGYRRRSSGRKSHW